MNIVSRGSESLSTLVPITRPPEGDFLLLDDLGETLHQGDIDSIHQFMARRPELRLFANCELVDLAHDPWPPSALGWDGF